MASKNDSLNFSEQSRIIYEKLPINFLSILANSLVIFLSFRSPEIPKSHFRYLIANTAFLGLLSSLGGLFDGLIFSYLHIYKMKTNIFACNVPFMIMYWSMGALFWSYAMTILCRYREIALSKQCSKIQVTFLISFPYITCLIDIALFVLFSDDNTKLAIKNGRKCSMFWYDIHQLLQVLIFLFPSVAFFILTMLSCKLYKFLKHHFVNTSANLKRSRDEQERLAEERSILRAIVIQGISPVFLFIPDALLFSYVLLSGSDPQILGFNLSDISGEFGRLNPLVDALSILFIVLSYKRARRKFFKDFSIGRKNTSMQSTWKTDDLKCGRRGGGECYVVCQEMSVDPFQSDALIHQDSSLANGTNELSTQNVYPLPMLQNVQFWMVTL